MVVLLLEGDELMLPLEPVLPPAEPAEPPEAPMLLELPDEPELPIDVLLPVLPDEPLAPLPAGSEPLPQALRDRAAAATRARVVLRERMETFIVGTP
ncbi:hypothetical protein [Ramlibacter pinisoli]|uniref:Uncharacterized protein n=1 Tax=Ramlibacter pinisoli TaxID=2682844 RepID=A0A6N8IQM0_9BURK|nr:hypothetical protein [Ramlibacter pinisoli]MVQ29012.1 hypothetical protein [Ramlibacter pinisoli]